MLKKLISIVFCMLLSSHYTIPMNPHKKKALDNTQITQQQPHILHEQEILQIKQELRHTQEELRATQAKLALLIKHTIHPQEIFEACRKGYLEEVQQLISLGIPPTLTNPGGCTILHTSITNQHPKIAEYLLQQHVPVNAQNNFDRTPLHIACYNSSRNCMIGLLLQYSACLDIQDDRGNTPLHDLISSGKDNHKDTKLTLIKLMLSNCFFLPSTTSPLTSYPPLREPKRLRKGVKTHRVIVNYDPLKSQKWDVEMIADRLELDNQKLLIKAWKTQKQAADILSLLNAHGERHLAGLQKVLKIKNNLQETVRDAALNNGDTYIAAFLDLIPRTTQFKSLEKNFQYAISKTIKNKLAIEDTDLTISEDDNS